MTDVNDRCEHGVLLSDECDACYLGEDRNAKRIRLAEARGWKRNRVDTVAVMGRPISHQRWFDSDGNDKAHLPDPFTDANDCEALIRWLNEPLNRRVSMFLTKEYHVVRLRDIDFQVHEWQGDDWKTGVCELTLKILAGDRHTHG